MIMKSILGVTMSLSVASCGSANVPVSIIPVPRPAHLIQPAYLIQMGETTVTLQVARHGQGPVFLALHENESTSIEAAEQVLPATGGTLVVLRHGGSRNVAFSMAGQSYQVDPNRIFTEEGIRRSLGGTPSAEVVGAVRFLADSIIGVIGSQPIVALHNNTDGGYSVTSYLPSGEFAGDALEVYQVAEQDPDNFFFTTDASLYASAQQSGFNVVLQSLSATDDGSLSVYSAMRGLPYVNVEAEHGQTQAQVQMLQWLGQTWY